MSRTQSQGIEYFPFAVDFFTDNKVKILKARYGADGIAIYMYILCCIYREGYYTKVNDDFIFIISDDLHISSETVQQVMTFLLKRSMFNEQLFKSDAILTSDGIQERWQIAVAKRAQKTPIKVSDYWLLNEADTKPYIKVAHFSDSSAKNTFTSAKKALNSANYPQSKVKESKEEKIYKKESTEFGKESEELESGNSDNPTLIAKESSFTDSTGKKRKGFIPPTLAEVQAYAKERGREDLAKKFFDYFEAGEWHDSEGKPVKAWKQKFITWEAHQPYADTIPRAGNGRPIKTVL